MNSEDQKFWEDWYYKNRETFENGENSSPCIRDVFLEAIKLAQEMQKKKDAELVYNSHWVSNPHDAIKLKEEIEGQE